MIDKNSMIINNALDFNLMILQAGLREKASGDLSEIMECVQFYSGMCGCNPESKDAKLLECNNRYGNFLKYNLKSIVSDLLEHFSSITFYHEEKLVTTISKFKN